MSPVPVTDSPDHDVAQSGHAQPDHGGTAAPMPLTTDMRGTKREGPGFRD